MPKRHTAKKAAKKAAAKKVAAKKAAPKKAAAKKAAAKPAGGGKKHTSVRVRMYRQGLGDCFLVTFDPETPNAAHMLIDCGSLGKKATTLTLKQAAANIRDATGNHLSLLVATHEHKDHVCGFRDAKPIFKDMKVDHVWMAWTEDPTDTLAQDIQVKKGDLGQALALAATALAGGDKEAAAMGRAVHSLLGFAGDPQSLGAAANAGTGATKAKKKKLKDSLGKTIDEAMTFVRTKTGGETSYLKPGQSFEVPWLKGFRFYVLGPPRSEKKLKDLGEDGSAELYAMAPGLLAGATLRAAGGMPDDASDESEMPFDLRFKCTEMDTVMAPALDAYSNRLLHWRRVDHDWLHSAADLALQLDSFTNNTSLALAIERLSDGKVLLFPADAQQGNWLSWHDEDMKLTSHNGEPKTAQQLLNATVFYKVGHHCSHNATAKGKGLGMMDKKDELVAFIPVDRQIALTRSPKGTWRMPAFELYRNLLLKCQGRVVRSDLGWADDAANAKNKAVEKELRNIAEAASWKRWKKAQSKAAKDKVVVIENDYVDYTLA